MRLLSVFSAVSILVSYACLSAAQDNAATAPGVQASSAQTGPVAPKDSAQLSSSKGNTLTPFVTDGCSLWIDGTPSQPGLWRHCCVLHDKAYWIGGTAQDRRRADQALQTCVSDLGGKLMGNYMYSFVIPGGNPYWLMPYRWGYGWKYLEAGKPRGYKTLTEAERVQVNLLMPQAEAVIAADAISHPVKVNAHPANEDLPK